MLGVLHRVLGVRHRVIGGTRQRTRGYYYSSRSRHPQGERAVVSMPCRHLCLCRNCSKGITRCPVCLVEIKENLEIYIT